MKASKQPRQNLQGDPSDDAAREIAEARRVWRLGDLEAATRHIETALTLLEAAGLWHRLGEVYKLHAMVFISRDKASLALAAAKRALGFPDINARDRMYLYATVAMALHQLVDLPAGGKVMLEQAWPEALKSGDRKTVVDCASRCAGLLRDYACWAMGIPNLNLVGVEGPPPAPAAASIARAHEFIAICEKEFATLEPPDQSWVLCQKGGLLTVEQGFDAAWPTFREAQQLATPSPRQVMMAEHIIGMSARVGGRPELALEHLLRSRSMESAQNEQSLRSIAWELSRVYEALGAPEKALAELQTFNVLQARKSKLAIEWTSNPANQRRYGIQSELRAAEDAMTVVQSPPAVDRARLYIEQNLHDAPGLEDIARAANVSKRTLQKLFRDHLRVTVRHFIHERRLQRADEALRQGTLRIADVAEQAGYSNPSNFSRDYRQRFGRSPSEVQREAAAG